MDRILTTHVGSLARPPELLAFLVAKERGRNIEEIAYAETLTRAVSEIVERQIDVGIDVIDDGELGKVSWITYLYERISGLETRPVKVEGSILPPSRDRQSFPGAYAALDALDEVATRGSSSAAAGARAEEIAEAEPGTALKWFCTGPVTYDRRPVERDIANLKAALAGHEGVEAFLPVVAPASTYWLENDFFASDEEFMFALADALHEEYAAIVEAGFLVQVDDAVIAHELDTMLSQGKSYEDYRKWARVRVDALNHALRGLPEDRVRYHICFGSWHGPHAFDPALRDELGVLDDVRVVGHDTGDQLLALRQLDVLPHPPLVLVARVGVLDRVVAGVHLQHEIDDVAQRLVRLAGLLGRENVIGGTDCGFAQGAFITRVHPEIQWAKLTALVEGARLATRELWGAKAAV